MEAAPTAGTAWMSSGPGAAPEAAGVGVAGPAAPGFAASSATRDAEGAGPALDAAMAAALERLRAGGGAAGSPAMDVGAEEASQAGTGRGLCQQLAALQSGVKSTL